MKKLLILGAALLGICSFGAAAHAGGDGYYDDDDNYRRPTYYEGRPVCREERVVVRRYCPPPVYVDRCPAPVVYGGYYGPRYRRYGYRRHRTFLPLPPLPRVSVAFGF